MFRISRLQQLMKGLPRGTFDSTVRRYEADKHSKGFGCWDQLLAMLFAQWSDSPSLRHIEAGFNAHSAHHYHLGTRELRRSTLAEANSKRNPAVFEETCRHLMASVGRKLRRQGDAFLYLLDSTSITLKGRGFDSWTADDRTRNTQGLKLHILLDAAGAVPVRQSITAPTINDVTEARSMPLTQGATYVFDKGYCDYNWWARFDEQDAFFVTRFKSNACLQVESKRPIPEVDRGQILADEVVRFSNRHPGGGRRNRYSVPLRRVVVQRPDHATPLVLATNDMHRTAADIARCYRDRWQVELFFKWIKQHLRIKRFLGRTENAVRIQILCGLIAYLLLAIHQKATGASGSLWSLLGAMRTALFQRPSVDAAVERRRRERQLAHNQVQPSLFA